MLLQRAVECGATLWQPCTAIAMESDGPSYRCRIKHSETSEILEFRSRVVVAAYGSWENTAFRDQSEKPASSKDLLGFKAHFSHAHLEPDLMAMLAFPGGYGGIVNTDAERLSMSCCIQRGVLDQARSLYGVNNAGEALQRHLVASCGSLGKVLAGAVREGRWLAAGPVRPGMHNHSRGNFFYVGNAAGEAHPIVAEGISMAIQSGWLLSDILLRPTGRPEGSEKAAREYLRSWSRYFRPRILAAAVFARIALSPFGRAVAMRLLQAFPRLITMGARLSGKRAEMALSE